MIIGINGRAGSGKDTVGKIIQDLTCKRTKGYSGILNQEVELIGSSNWQIKKFADKLKDIVCILIGCTRSDLEDQTFKETPLGKEWWYWKVKDSEKNPWYLLSYSDRYDLSEFYDAELIKSTPRLLLQKIGTDLFREQLNPNIWVNSLLNDYKFTELAVSKYRSSGLSSQSLHGDPYPNWIITDMRFKNEKKRIEELGNITIRVNRKSGILPCVGHEFQHSSENDLDKETFSYTINNNGSIEDLIEVVKEILIREGIIK